MNIEYLSGTGLRLKYDQIKTIASDDFGWIYPSFKVRKINILRGFKKKKIERNGKR